MQEIFEKVIEELKQESIITDDDAGHRAIEIIRQTAAEYNNGWVPAEEPPKNSNYILLSFENFTVPLVGRYEEDQDGGAYYAGNDPQSCISEGLIVNAWQPLPEPYQPFEPNLGRSESGKGVIL